MRRIVIDRVPVARLGYPVETDALEYYYEELPHHAGDIYRATEQQYKLYQQRRAEQWHVETDGEYITATRKTRAQLRDENIARLEKELGIGQ